MSVPQFRVLPRSKNKNDQVSAEQRKQDLQKTLLIFFFLAPGMLIFFLFVLMPIGQSTYYSFYDWDGLGSPTDFIGLGNYTRILNHSVFQLSVAHSLIITTLSLVVQLPLSLALALLVGRGELHFKKLFRTILFVPYVFSEVITALIWRSVLSPNEGALLNSFLALFIPNFEPVGWLANRDIVLYVFFGVLTWKFFGFHMILYMAGLQGIPEDLEDAARVDGAKEWEVLRYVTLPLLGSTIRLTIFLSVLGSFQQFVLAWVLTNGGGPVNASQIFATYLYKYGLQQFKLGYGSAIAILLFIIAFAFSLGYQRTIMKQDLTMPKSRS